ncbi:MAG: NAD(P)/FAD-dependent oxidoreductase [Dehalococcoidia bacterium]|nr:NAD(P)/FAD-dependent oxidoreductase [Dehalococcoidia bacterium]
MMSSLHKLFTPVKIGSMELRNRLVMAPMTTQWAGPGDTVSQRLIDYHVARARGGVGLITFEVCTVDEKFPYQVHTVGLWGDHLIPSHAELTKAVHAHGAKIVPQISHPGPESAAPFVNQLQPIGPSVGRSAVTGQTCREVTLEEIEMIIEQYGEAARRAREAGYDGMELHCAHAYMLCGSFITPLRNRRTDAYNGSTTEGLLKFPIEVIKSMKAKAGKDFPLTLRISGDERQPGGRDLKGTLEIVPRLVEAGVDAFHVSGGVIDRLTTGIIAGSSYGSGFNVPEAAAIKKVTHVPVMVVGRIHDPELAEKILQAGQADMIVMGRPLLGDPELPNKAARGELRRIRRCISCENCFDSIAEGDFTNMHCAINAFTGKEAQLSLEKTVKPKKVMVVGGGPAGMEAARVAASRGHSVTLYERQARLGGSLFFANTVHPDNDRLLNYLLAEMKSLPIQIKLKREITPTLMETLKPDVVILATGPRIGIPPIPRSDRRNVFAAPDMKRMLAGDARSPGAEKLPTWQRLGLRMFGPLMERFLTPRSVRRFTRYWMPVGKRVVVIGGDLGACELAVFLAERGRKVTLLDSGKRVAPEVGYKRRGEVKQSLEEAKVTVVNEVTYDEIGPSTVLYTVKGEKKSAGYDTVVIAGDVQPNLELYRALEGKVPELYSIGDCNGLGLIRRAIQDGASVACRI